MSRKASPTIIGLFIVLGLSLALGSVLLVSSSRFFTKTKPYILYFDATLTGLDPGTSVKFRGVTIGHVREVLIHLNQAPGDASLPVIIELDESLLRARSDDSFKLTDDVQLAAHIKQGLRGKLEAQSLLTGLLYVELEFLPKAPPPTYHQLKPLYQEIPTAPTEIQIFRVDFADIAQKLNALLTKLDASLGEIQVREINRSLTNLLAPMNAVTSSPELTNTLVSAHQTLEEVRLLSVKLRSRVDGLAEATDKTMAESRATLAESRTTLTEMRGAVQDIRDLLAPQAQLRRDMDTTLSQLAEAARSVTELAEFLKRNPNAILSGKKPVKGAP